MATSFNLLGDKFQAIRYKHFAENMLDELERSVMFLNKKQLASRRTYPNGVVITCNYVFGQRLARIFYPVKTINLEKIKLIEQARNLSVFLIISRVTDKFTWVGFSSSPGVLEQKAGQLLSAGHNANTIVIYKTVIIWPYDSNIDDHPYLTALEVLEEKPSSYETGTSFYITPTMATNQANCIAFPEGYIAAKIHCVVFDNVYVIPNVTMKLNDTGNELAKHDILRGQYYIQDSISRINSIVCGYSYDNSPAEDYAYVRAESTKFIVVNRQIDAETTEIQHILLQNNYLSDEITFSDIRDNYIDSISATFLETEATLSEALAAITVKQDCLKSIELLAGKDKLTVQVWVPLEADYDPYYDWKRTAFPFSIELEYDSDDLLDNLSLTGSSIKVDCANAVATTWGKTITENPNTNLWGQLTNILPTEYEKEITVDYYASSFLTVFPFVTGGYTVDGEKETTGTVDIHRNIHIDWRTYDGCVDESNNPLTDDPSETPAVSTSSVTTTSNSAGTDYQAIIISDEAITAEVRETPNHSIITEKAIMFYSKFILTRKHNIQKHYHYKSYDGEAELKTVQSSCCTHYDGSSCDATNSTGNTYHYTETNYITGGGIGELAFALPSIPIPTKYVLPDPGHNIDDYWFTSYWYEYYQSIGYTAEEAIEASIGKDWNASDGVPQSTSGVIPSPGNVEEKRVVYDGANWGVGEIDYPEIGGNPGDYDRTAYVISDISNDYADIDNSDFALVVEATATDVHNGMRFTMNFFTNTYYDDTLTWFYHRHLIQQFNTENEDGTQDALLFFKSYEGDPATALSINGADVDLEQVYLFYNNVNYYDNTLIAMKTLYAPDINSATKDNDILTYMFMV